MRPACQARRTVACCGPSAWAVHATPRRWDKLRVPLVEGRVFQDEKYIRLNPELEIANRQQNALGLSVAAAPVFFETGGECLLLLRGLQFREQKRVANADFVFVECLDNCRRKLGQLQTGCDVGGIFARACSNLLDGVSRLLQIEQGAEAVGLLHRVNVAALQVLDDGHFECLGVGEVDDADGQRVHVCHPRGAVTPRSCDDLEAALIQRSHKQGRENALTPYALGQLLQGFVLKNPAWVGGGLGEHGDWQVAVLGSVDDGGIHDDGSFRAVGHTMGE